MRTEVIRESSGHWKDYFKIILLWCLAGFFSWATVILAAGPIRALRVSSNGWAFYFSVSLISSILGLLVSPAAGIIFALTAILVGLFTDLEGWGAGRGLASTGAVLAVASVGGV